MDDAFAKFLLEKRTWYKSIGKVYCPLLDEWIIFNSRGFRHLLYDSHGKRRSRKEQIYKLKLLPLVMPVIKNATQAYDYKKGQYSRPLGKNFEIWELRGVAGRRTILVSAVLRRIGDGNITFFSVWRNRVSKMNKKDRLS